ncbi:dual oxidase maturation factor 1-like [Hypanus sabinus]|uniref:dual oxidase maturation factor 1-like n=1 Tax=Hypanus sabinus TaxID=79690 RepID=UPI0028C3AA6B|nr:dual oxidase maturation factor 1-like [Hypanus sabinus]
MTFYDGRYPFYPIARPPVVFNTIQIVVIIIFLVFLLAFLIVLIGIRGTERLHGLMKVTLSLFIGVVIVVVNFTTNWERGFAIVNTTYKSFSKTNVVAEVGLHVGLAGLNITLKGLPQNQLNETINYNEEFLWMNGRIYENEYRKGLERGLPDPILYVAEKFTPSSPCGVYLQYRVSGTYASATMWVALVAWMLANILLWINVLLYGAYMMLVSGFFMIFSVISFGTTRKTPLCDIQFDQVKLDSALGPSFWLSLATALLTLLIGATITVLSFFAPKVLSRVFLINDDNNDEDASIDHYYNVSFQEENKPTNGLQLKSMEGAV